MSLLFIVYLALFVLFARVIYVLWPSLYLVCPLLVNPKIMPSDVSFIQPGTLILTKIKTSPYSVNHLSLALSNDRIFECMTTKKKRVRYHFFSFHVDYILPKLVNSASHLAIRQPLTPLNAEDLMSLSDLAEKASNMDFNRWYELDLFQHRILGAQNDEALPKGNKTFCSQYISVLLRSILRIHVGHNWSLPSEFSSAHPHDVLRGYYSEDASIPISNLETNQ